MPTPSTSLATLRPDLASSLEEFDLAADRMGFIGHMVLPVLEVGKASGKFGRIPIEQLLQNRDTARSSAGGYSRGKFTFTDDSYVTEEHGAEEVVDDREESMYRDYFDAEVVATARARDVVLRNAEVRAASLLFNATTFSSQKTTLTNEWDDAANATPIDDVEAALKTIWDRCGLLANTLIVNWKVFRNLRNVTQIIDRIKYSGRDDPKAENITASMLAEVFGIDRIVVARPAKNTATEGQTASISPVWSDEYAMLCRVAETQDHTEPCVGRTMHWDEDGSQPMGTIESYRDETVRADIVRVRHEVDEKLILTECAQLFDNVTT